MLECLLPSNHCGLLVLGPHIISFMFLMLKCLPFLILLVFKVLGIILFSCLGLHRHTPRLLTFHVQVVESRSIKRLGVISIGPSFVVVLVGLLGIFI